MVDIKYANAYSEVIEILKYISKEEYNKIPKEKIELFEFNANPDYHFDYNPYKTLQEQNVSKIARGIIAILCRDYWVTEKQREKIVRWQHQERNRIENEKKEKYKSEDLFRNNKIASQTEEVSLVEIKEEKWYDKVFKFFRRIIRFK